MQPFKSNPCSLKSCLEFNIERHLPTSTCLWMILLRLNAKCPFVCTCNQLRNPDYKRFSKSWWRQQMETFSALLAIYAGNSPVSGEIPAQRSVTRSFDVFFDLCLNKRLSKQWWGWWFETLSCPLWRHSNGLTDIAFDHVFYRPGGLVQTRWDRAGNLVRIACLLHAKPRISDTYTAF